MIFNVMQIFSGKISEDCYLFTLKARDIKSSYCTDIGTVIINSKTDSTLISIDKNMTTYIATTLVDKAIEDSKKMVKDIEKML